MEMMNNMDQSKHTEKEKAIFNGLMGLIKSGYNPYTIKVSDIAKSANIGKGTIYDYFESKEEAISKAVLYYIDKEMESAYCRVSSRKNFKDKFYELLYIINDSYKNNISIYNMIFSNNGVTEFYQHLSDIEIGITKCIDMVYTLIEDLLDAGMKEGLISVEGDSYYLSTAIRSSVAGFSYYVSKKERYNEITTEKAMEVSYKILLKALN